MTKNVQEIDGIGPAAAQELKSDGITTVEELADADPSELTIPRGNEEELVQRAQQQTISSQNVAELLDDHNDSVFQKTGIEDFDDVLGGGWEPETIGLIYGKSGQGKSQVAFQSLVEAAKEGTAVYLQTEMQSKSIAERILEIADDRELLENISIYEAYDVEEQFSTYGKIAEDLDDISLLVIDSFTAQFRVSSKYDGRENLSQRSADIGEHLNFLGKMARKRSIPIVLVGQVYPSPEAYGKEDNIWGGQKMEHFVSYFVRVSNGQGELNTLALENHPGKGDEEIPIYISDDGVESR